MDRLLSWHRPIVLWVLLLVLFLPDIAAPSTPRLMTQWTGDKIWDAAYSPDGKYLVLGEGSNFATLWDLATAKIVRRFSGHSGEVKSVAFFPDGRRVATAGENTVLIWDVRTADELKRLPASAVAGKAGYGSSIAAIALSHDGRQLLMGRWDYSASLWDVDSGKPIRTFPVKGPVLSVALSRRANRALTGENGLAELWELSTGRRLAILAGNTKRVNFAAFTADGKHCLTAGEGGRVILWSAADGRELRRIQVPPHRSMAAALDPGKPRIITAGRDQRVRLWDLRTGRELRQMKWDSDWANTVAFSPDGTEVLVAGYPGSGRWKIDTGVRLPELAGKTAPVSDVAFSGDGRQFAAQVGFRIFRWSLTGSVLAIQSQNDFFKDSGQGADRFSREGEPAFPQGSDAISPDGRFAARVAGTVAVLKEKSSGRQIARLAGPAERIYSIAFSPNGKILAAGGRQPATSRVKLWSVPAGGLLQSLEHPSDVFCVAFSPNSSLLATACYDGKVRIWRVTSGSLMREISFEGRRDYKAAPTDVAFSPDGSRIAVGGFGAAPRIYDVNSGRALGSLGDATGRVAGVSYSPDGRFVALARSKEGAAIYDAHSFQLLAHLVPFTNGDWSVVDPAGRYDASHGGDVEGQHWVVDLEPIDLDQLKERYYDPGLLSKKLGFNPEPVRNVAAFTDPGLYPEVRITSFDPKDALLRVKLTNRGGGIGKVLVSVNRKEILADARGPGPDPDAATLQLKIPLAGNRHLIPGEDNLIEIKAYNAEGYLASRGVQLAYRPPAPGPRQKPTLWAVVAGIADYQGDRIDLRFAAKDARNMKTALELAAGRLFGVDRVRIKLLATEDGASAISPTKAALRQAFAELSNASPVDILVIYLAGHGVAVGEHYYYLTQEARSADLSDPAIREQTAVSSEELVDWLKTSPATKQVMVLDTCAAGTAAASLVKKREISSDQIRALERLKDRTGLHVLMGSAADAVSYEASQYEQGLLTYALLQGMRGVALKDDVYVDVSSLFQYAADTVPGLAEHIGGIQRPRILAPRDARSFDIGMLRSEDRKAIPLAETKRLLLRPVLQNSAKHWDNLELTVKVREQFRLAGQAPSGTNPSQYSAVYINADDLPGAIRPSGAYMSAGGVVTVQLVLVKDGVELKSLQISGSQNDLDALSRRIVKQIYQAVDGL